MKKIFSFLATVIFMSGCNITEETVPIPLTDNSDSVNLSNLNILEETDSFTNECFITLGNTITINGQGAWLDDNCIKISGGGVYVVTGTMSDGMIYVDGDETVKLILDNASITNTSGCAIFSSGKKLIIEALEGTENFLSDSESYEYSEDFENKEEKEPNSAVYAKNTLLLTGNGRLSVKGSFKNGITGNDELIIKEANVLVEATDNGIKGKDSITAEKSDITVLSGGDSLKTDNADEGNITIKDCTLSIETDEDGIQADSVLSITGGDINITAKGDVTADENLSSKGLKGAEVSISDCSLTVNSIDHAVKSTGVMNLDGGSLTLYSESEKE